jgi:hypothetical protein
LLLVPAGCSKKEVRPSVTYDVSVITKGNDGKATPQGSVTRVESAGVEAVQVLTHEGHTLSLVVRKTQYAKATFDITFPDNATQRVQVKVGEPKDILPRGQKIGVRIELSRLPLTRSMKGRWAHGQRPLDELHL